jgi:bloom syndrome protein
MAGYALPIAASLTTTGHDFRKAFQELRFFKQEFPDVPMICCTATATSRVRQDIISTLMLDESKLKSFQMTTSRPNLHYEVRFTNYEEDRYDDFLYWLKAVQARRSDDPTRREELVARQERLSNVPGIIYTLTRNETENLAARLTADGIGAKAYHAKLDNDQKADHLQGWVANKEGYDVIVATTAFGMGIDKGNVRFVVHWSMPKSFEGYYQEAGRAGRDGKASLCILYYSREDRDRNASIFAREQDRMQHNKGYNRQSMELRGKSLQSLIGYCESVTRCRHKLIATYFGDPETPPCEWACDWHKDKDLLARKKANGLANEEWCATQRETGAYSGYDEYD